MSDEDERLVEVIAKALAADTTPDGVPHKWMVEQAGYVLSALRAEGCEVVRWRPHAEGYQAVGPDDQYTTWPKRGDTTHFAILRGPEVKP